MTTKTLSLMDNNLEPQSPDSRCLTFYSKPLCVCLAVQLYNSNVKRQEIEAT